MKFFMVLVIPIMLSTGCVSYYRTSTFDTDYGTVSYDSFNEALSQSHIKMKNDGWLKYRKEALDCEDYALKLVVEIRKYLSDQDTLSTQAIPVGFCVYTRDEGTGHCVVFVEINDSRYYFEPYPLRKYLNPISMSADEIRSVKAFM